MVRSRLVAGLAASVLAFGLAMPAAAQEVVLKLHQFLPAQSFVPVNILDPWADRIEAESQGRIRIERFPAMQLGGKPADLVDQMQDGVVDIVWTLPGYTPGRFPRTEVFELPFMVRDAEGASRAFWQLAQSDMRDADFKDMHLLGAWVHGPGVIHSARPVARLEDMAGLKLRAPSRATTRLLEQLGAVAVGMPVPAVPEAMSKGVIDGALLPWEVTSSIKVQELVGHHTEFPGRGVYVATFILAMNKDVYEGLPQDLRAVIDAASGEGFSAQAGRLQQGADAPQRQVAADRGNAIVTLDAAEAARWETAAAPVTAAWVAELEAAGIDGQALLDKARGLLAQNAN